MTARTIALTALACLVLVAPGAVATGSAAPIPFYFEDEWVAFLCLTASPPGSGPIPLLLQFNFDKSVNGGIPLDRADSLFAYLAGQLGLLSPIIGSTPQTTCSLTPSQTLASYPLDNARSAAQQLSGSFSQIGFARYVIVDAFLNITPEYLGGVLTLRMDVFAVNGDNDLSYAASNELLESSLP